MKLRIISFGFRNGIPKEASCLVDCRIIRNPYHDKKLRKLRGTDDEVKAQVRKHSAYQKIMT